MKLEEFYKKNLRHNFLFVIFEGAFISLSNGMAPLTTVLLFFISGFVPQKWIIGLLPCLFSFLVFSPQVLVSKKIEQLRNYRKFALFISFINKLPWLFLALDVYFLADKKPILFIIIFYFLYSMYGLTIGFSGLTSICRISKVIPEHARGRLMGSKSTVGGIFELVGSFAMGLIIKSLGYPINYSLLFLTVFILSSVSLLFTSVIKETDSEYIPVKAEDNGYIKKMRKILGEDKAYSFFIICIILINAFGKMAFAFQTIYAKEKLGIDTQNVFIATIILLSSQTIGYMLWGYIGDKFGHRRPLIISSVIFLPTILFTYLMTNQTVFLFSTFLLGISQSAFNVNTDNLSMSLCKDKASLPTYIGLRCFITGPFIAFSSLLGGFIIDRYGYNTVFLISTIFILAGLYTLVNKVKEN